MSEALKKTSESFSLTQKLSKKKKVTIPTFM
jgi:hypothetical protein